MGGAVTYTTRKDIVAKVSYMCHDILRFVSTLKTVIYYAIKRPIGRVLPL